jgi:hypothetical protein
MADRPWWGTTIQWSLWAVAMTLVMGWLGKSRHRPRPTADQRVLAHPPSTLIMGLVCFVFFAGIAVVSNVFANKTTTWWTTAGFLGFALLSVPMISDYFIARHKVSEEGMAYRKITGAAKYLRWSELRAVRYTPTMKWFRLETQSGDVARISVMLMGLPEFARLVLAHAPQQTIDDETLPVLQATANDQPPSVWG